MYPLNSFLHSSLYSISRNSHSHCSYITSSYRLASLLNFHMSRSHCISFASVFHVPFSPPQLLFHFIISPNLPKVGFIFLPLRLFYRPILSLLTYSPFLFFLLQPPPTTHISTEKESFHGWRKLQCYACCFYYKLTVSTWRGPSMLFVIQISQHMFLPLWWWQLCIVITHDSHHIYQIYFLLLNENKRHGKYVPSTIF